MILLNDYKKYPERKFINELMKKFSLRNDNFRFDKKKYLISLNLYNIPLKKIPIEIGFFLKLKEINLSNTSITKIEGLDKFSQLEKLYLEQNIINKIEGLERLSNLTTLYLHFNKINKIEGLDNLIKLKVLWLYKNEIKQIENLNNLPNLQDLNLGWNQITQIEGLEKISQLERLQLNNNDISKIEGLENLTQLKFLNLNKNRIRKMVGLNKNLELQYLYLKKNRITKIEGLNSLFKLDKIELDGNSLNKEHKEIIDRGIGAIHENFIEKIINEKQEKKGINKLNLKDYEEIIVIIYRIGLEMQRHPKQFFKLKEPELRNELLVHLNIHYKGAATGETINNNGKTDILIRRDNKNILIAECKIWRDEAWLIKGIKQLLGYLTWEDINTAIILFCKNKKLTPIIKKAREILENHTCYEKKCEFIEDELKNEKIILYKFHNSDDFDKKLNLTLIVIHIPDN